MKPPKDNDNPEDIKELADRLEDKTLEMMREIHGAFDPEWRSRTDILKTIVSLSSGSIILAVTFSSSIRSLSIDLVWRRLIVVSFALFFAALLLAFLALWFGSAVYELQSSMFGKRTEIKEAIKTSTSQADFMEKFFVIFDDAFEPISERDRYAIGLFKASSICFCIAIFLLALVGFRQLSF